MRDNDCLKQLVYNRAHLERKNRTVEEPHEEDYTDDEGETNDEVEDEDNEGESSEEPDSGSEAAVASLSLVIVLYQMCSA